MGNKNEQERSRNNRLISEKERNIDELSDDRRKLEDSLLFLNDHLQRGYRSLTSINEEDLRDGDHETLRLQRMNEEQEQLFHRHLQETEEEVLESYRSQRKVLDGEIEKLHKKRSEIPWD
ncbi:hypothetical protein I6N95_03730 [Vagococcus sp. BWB3-3]|uniref:Uncharacterized protein n=1 Tax=Vagococcus allomyrinae TaxID=2794353 RepID=A0A940P316_9ENTE|nr:hypothetical protein [Vagococcus allomyrinae]MBP1040115.1 hypothetical protein [Vagococcus allomyrinae]